MLSARNFTALLLVWVCEAILALNTGSLFLGALTLIGLIATVVGRAATVAQLKKDRECD